MRSIAAVLPKRLGKPYYGWAVVLVATLATFCSGPGQSFVFSVFVDPILADTGISRVYLSTLYAFGTAVSAAVVVLVARLADRFGAQLMLAVIALALAPLPLAAFRQLSGDYWSGLLVTASIPVVCAVMSRFFDPERARREAESVGA